MHYSFAGRRGGLPLWTKVMRKEARYTQMRDRASGVHPDILEHLPPRKNRVCLQYCFVLSPLISLGAVPNLEQPPRVGQAEEVGDAPAVVAARCRGDGVVLDHALQPRPLEEPPHRRHQMVVAACTRAPARREERF